MSACETVPGPGKGKEVRARSPPVRGQHRAHASTAVHVGARDDALARPHPLEHRAARRGGQAVDRATELIHGLAAGAMTVCHRLLRRRMPTGCGHPMGVGRRQGCHSAQPRGNGDPLLKGKLRMKLGVHIGYWGLGLSSEDQLNIVQEAEHLGYDSVWAAEAYGSDTATLAGLLPGAVS